MAAERASVFANRPLAPPRVAPQRVLMTADTATGIWPYALDLCRALIARGHDVALATMGPLPDRFQRREAGAIANLALYPGAYRLAWMDDAWSDVRAAGRWLLRLAGELRPDVVHLNDFGYAHLAWPVPVLMFAHSCEVSRWREVHGAPLPLERMRYRRCVEESLRAADLVVAPSHAMLRMLRRHYGALPAARVIAAGRSATDAPAPKGSFVFCGGRCDDASSNADALAAAARGLAWPVCIAGGVRERRPRANLRVLGRLAAAHVRRWLAHAPVFACPARYEPSGLGVLEAALAGCALVLADIESLRENWDGAATFVAPDDHAGLARALQRLIDDPALRARQADSARRRASRYSPAMAANAYIDAYGQLARA